jgi:hypothetical protein
MVNGTLNEFTNKFIAIEKQLEMLNREYSMLFKEFEGNEFDLQQQYVNKLDDIVLLLTHKSATSIGFTRNQLETLSNFILFSKLYCNFSEDQLEITIDNTDSAIHELLTRTELKPDQFTTIKNIREEWHNVFLNKNFKKVKNEIDSKS